jgi:preprotein translocase subunit SecA
VKDFLFKVYTDKEQALTDPDLMRKIERGVFLNVIDTLWMEHIDNMSQLRDSVALKGYGQRDPLIEYKEQAYIMFSTLLNSIDHNTISTLFKINIAQQIPERFLKVSQPRTIITNTDEISKVTSGEHKFAEQSGSATGNPVIVKVGGNTQPQTPEVGRNEPCPCGSGKKYKKCHGV